MERYYRLARRDELGPGEARDFLVNGWPILLVGLPERVHAVINRCTHAASPLKGGRVRRSSIICPLHGAPFDLQTGACLSKATPYQPLKIFPVRVEEDWIAVAVPEQPPPSHLMPLPATAEA